MSALSLSICHVASIIPTELSSALHAISRPARPTAWVCSEAWLHDSSFSINKEPVQWLKHH